jgi:RimJ/RimL family protein N-acetyltransferase
MNGVSFEVIDPNNLEQAKEFVSWYKNPLMIKNWVLQREESTPVNFEVEDFKKQFSVKENSREKHAFMIKVNDNYIGYGQFYINHPVAVTKDGRVCWPSIAIGNDDFRGQGFGLEICKQIYEHAKKLNCTHIEAGIFEFNKKMKKMLVDNGFVMIDKKENLTFVDGKWWASEHYLLKL